MLLIATMTETGLDPVDESGGFFSRHERLMFCLVTVGLLAISAALHLWRLGSAPPGFYLDESAHAYNAYCIALTGADEYGVQYPMFFRSFGEFKDPVMVYSLVPFVKVFGLTQWAARLPGALYLLATSIAFACLAQRYCRNKWLSVVAGFCFSLLPWIFTAGRPTTPYAAMLLGMTVGWGLMLRAFEKESYGCAIAAGAAWAFAMYSYSAGRMMTVLLLACFCVGYARMLRTRWKVGLVFAISWIGALIPMAVGVARVPHALTNRFQEVSIFRDHPAWGEAFYRMVSQYVEYFGPQFLFLKGDGNLRHHSGFGGELFLFLVPAIVAGVYCLVRQARGRPEYRFLGLGLLVYPIAATLTVDPMHSGRSIDGVIVWGLTAAVGADFLWQRRGMARGILVVACCAGSVEMGLYLRDYFGPYQIRSRGRFDAAFTEALEDCFRIAGPTETVYISKHTFILWEIAAIGADFKPEVYADILFFSKTDPRVYQRGGFSKERVSLYDGTIRKSGVLLRSNVRWVEVPYDWSVTAADTKREPSPAGTSSDKAERSVVSFFEPNIEPIPTDARLVETKPAGGVLRYEVYRVERDSREDNPREKTP
jgi:4-amino-4-deoxy-L-arabinose transferase-like glycosyltransferase